MGVAEKVTKHGHFYCNAYDFGMDKSNAFYNVCDDWAVRTKEES
jgi:hypothetical protein